MAGITFELAKILSEEQMSVQDLVRTSGVNRNTLYGLRNNTATRVDLNVLQRICDALSRPLSAIMKYEPPAQGSDSIVTFSAADKRAREGLIFIISGPSGAGKNTLINQLKGLHLGLHFIPSFSTRGMREGECQGDPYYFVSLDDFRAMVERGEFLEYEQIHGNYYGTHAKTYERAIHLGFDAIKDIDVKGALNFRRRFGERAILIYVRPTELEVLWNRLADRGDSEDDIRRRMERIQFEESKREMFQHVIYNDNVEIAKNELLRIIQSNT